MKIHIIKPCKMNNLFLIPIRANFLPPSRSGYILCIVVEYLTVDDLTGTLCPVNYLFNWTMPKDFVSFFSLIKSWKVSFFGRI